MITRPSNTSADQETEARLELFYQVSKQVEAVPRMRRMLENIIEMTQDTLDASAASILLFDDDQEDLYFEAASGPVGNKLNHVKVDKQSGIAGQVARTGKPLIVNDVSLHPDFQRSIDEITGFVTKSLMCVPLVTSQKTIGVLELLNKQDGRNFDDSDVRAAASVATTAAMAIENTRLHQTILDAYKTTIMTLAEAIDAKDPYTFGHSQRVREYALLAGSTINLSPEEMETLEYASILHDIGKISVDTRILNKPDALTQSEWRIIHEHPTIGAHLLKKIRFLEKASEIVMHHHERYDGKGYPNGLKGEAIPLEARLISVADAFDTMTTDRSYRKAFRREYALAELRRSTGTQFCPVAVRAFVTGFKASIADSKSDSPVDTCTSTADEQFPSVQKANAPS